MSQMTVVEHGDGGAPEVMTLGQRTVPEPGAGEVLIKVIAAGVNGPDLKQRAGNYPPPPGASDLMGLEVSGEVAEIGSGISGWSVGNTVCALTNGGGYAEFVSVPAGQCLPLPDGVGLVIDMSHSAERSTLEAIEYSSRPIAITHANPAWWHPGT